MQVLGAERRIAPILSIISLLGDPIRLCPLYKYGKIEQTIDREIFHKLLDRVSLVDRCGYSTEFIQALTALYYWTGLRASEILGGLPHKVKRKDGSVTYTQRFPPLLKEQMWTDNEFLLVRQVARKGGHRIAPLEIPLTLDYVDLIVKQWQATEPQHAVFPINYVTYWRVLKRLDPKLYPHFFILNRLTKQADDPEISQAQQEEWSGKSPQTIASYRARSGRFTRKTGQRMLRET